MKKFVVCIACFALTLALAACGAGGKETVIGGDPATWGPSSQTSETNENESVQIPNPWQECSSLEEAGKLAGFSFTAPETLEGYSEKYIAAIENDIAEVIFSNGENDDAQVSFRKGTGSEDVSGDYSSYSSVEVQQIDGKDVTVKSNDSVIYTVIWTNEGYSYAVSARTGMTAEQMADWVQALA